MVLLALVEFTGIGFRTGVPVSLSGASVAQGAVDMRVVCWLDAFTAAWLGDCRLWLV